MPKLPIEIDQKISSHTYHNDDFSIMDENIKDKEYWYNKVKENGLMLEKVPMEMRTEDVCRAAVYSDSRAFQYVPSKYTDIFLDDIEEFGGTNLGWFPEDALTDEIIIASMEDFFFWGDVPESKKTKKVCLEAIKRDLCKLNEIPEKILDYEIYFRYIRKRGESIKFVPQKFLTEELCKAAVFNYGMAIEFVPKRMKTYDLYLSAIQSNANVLQIIPRKFKTEEVYMEYLKLKGGYYLEEIPYKKRTINICLLAVRSNGLALKFVPYSKRESNICIEAIKDSKSSIIYVPKKLFSNEFCRELLLIEIDLFYKIPRKCLTEEICFIAIENNQDLLEDIPKKYCKSIKRALNI